MIGGSQTLYALLWKNLGIRMVMKSKPNYYFVYFY